MCGFMDPQEISHNIWIQNVGMSSVMANGLKISQRSRRHTWVIHERLCCLEAEPTMRIQSPVELGSRVATQVGKSFCFNDSHPHRLFIQCSRATPPTAREVPPIFRYFCSCCDLGCPRSHSLLGCGSASRRRLHWSPPATPTAINTYPYQHIRI